MAKLTWEEALETFTKGAKATNSFDVILKAGGIDLSFFSLDTDLELDDVLEVLKDAASFITLGERELIRLPKPEPSEPNVINPRE